MAHPMPIGIEMIAAPAVTRSDPRISGNMPSRGGSDIGYQLFPKRNLKGPSILNTASPSLSRNRNMSKTKNIEAMPQIRIRFSIMNSVILRISLFFNRYEIRS